MTRLLVGVIATCGLAGCHRAGVQDLPSIRPSHPVEGYLSVPAHDHYFFVVATIDVPDGYETQQMMGQRIQFTRRRDDPKIVVRSSVSGRSEDFEPDLSEFVRCESHGNREYRILRRETRPNGSLLVCGERLHLEDRTEELTLVARDYSWRDHDFECSVGLNDHGQASDALVEDAISICDSLSVRDATQADNERFQLPFVRQRADAGAR